MLVKDPKTINQAIVLFLKLLHGKVHVYHEISNYEYWCWHEVDNNLSTEGLSFIIFMSTGKFSEKQCWDKTFCLDFRKEDSLNEHDYLVLFNCYKLSSV